MNPIINMLTGMSPIAQSMNQAKQMAQAIQSGNPLQTIGQNNPQMKQVMDYINSCGGNPEQAFYQLAKERGVDPQQILDQVKSIM